MQLHFFLRELILHQYSLEGSHVMQGAERHVRCVHYFV